VKKFFALAALALVGCGAFTPSAKMQEDALAVAYSACVKDADVQKAAEQAGMTAEQMCGLVMNAVIKQLQEKQDAGSCADGTCPAP